MAFGSCRSMLDCPDLAVPLDIMRHVVHVESARNPFAVGVVGGRLSRQPRDLNEALEAVRVLKEQGFNFSVGIAQVNRYNLNRYGLQSYAQAFEVCPNLQVGAKILKECHDRARDWGKAFSCYYSGNFVTGFQHGYVQKVFDAMERAQAAGSSRSDITVIPRSRGVVHRPARDDGVPLRADESTAETRVAPEQASASKAAPALAGIPLQVIGSVVDPYRVQVVPDRAPAATALPSPDRATRPSRLPADSPDRRRGSLVGTGQDSSAVHTSASPADSPRSPTSEDRSFVF